MEKQQLRHQLRLKRRQLSANQIKTLGIELVNQLRLEPLFQSADTLFLYMAMQEEVETLPLIEEALSQGKKVYLPRVIDKTQMVFYPFESVEKLEKSKFGVLEPRVTIAMTPEETQHPLMIVPALGYNQAGFRLGYGAGYYDRYLEAHTIKSIGVCYDFQLNEDWTPMRHDKQVDKVIFIETTSVCE